MGAGLTAEVLPGVWRLALELPWPGSTAANAWLLATDGGTAVVDTGMSCEGSFEQLTAGIADAGFALHDITQVVCTHAHADHAGQAEPLARAAGCELWMHADHRHATAPLADREAEVARRLATGRRCGVPPEALAAYAAAIRAQDLGFAGAPHPDRVLREGVELDTASGTWRVVETPGHAPSHVCLYEPSAGLLLSGDHLLERPSLGFDHGFTPDPVGELLRSLARVEELGARMLLPGHGDPFQDVDAAIAATRAAIGARLDAVRAAVAGGDARTPFEVADRAYAPIAGPEQAGWMFAEALCMIEHLELRGEARLAEPLRWH